MIVFPAIDIKDGKVVRLLQGRFEDLTQYSNDPVAMAQQWESLGARWLHVVDLDGAQNGLMKNIDGILDIAKKVKIPVQVGGGVRDEEIIERLMQGGVSRVILGTRVVEDESFLSQVLKNWSDKIAVSLDHSGGYVVTRGWAVLSELSLMDFAQRLESLGLEHLISTNIAKDGMLNGPDFAGLEQLLGAVKMSIIASGGVSSLADIQRLIQMKTNFPHLSGVITGKAIYEGRLDFNQAVKLCSTNA